MGEGGDLRSRSVGEVGGTRLRRRRHPGPGGPDRKRLPHRRPDLLRRRPARGLPRGPGRGGLAIITDRGHGAAWPRIARPTPPVLSWRAPPRIGGPWDYRVPASPG